MEQWNALGKRNDSSHTIGCCHWRGQWTDSLRSRDDQVILFPIFNFYEIFWTSYFQYERLCVSCQSWQQPRFWLVGSPTQICHGQNNFLWRVWGLHYSTLWQWAKILIRNWTENGHKSPVSRNGYCQCAGNNLPTDSCYTSMLFDIFYPTILCLRFSMCKNISTTWQRQILANEIVSYD